MSPTEPFANDARDAAAMVTHTVAVAVSMNVSFFMMLFNPLSWIPQYPSK